MALFAATICDDDQIAAAAAWEAADACIPLTLFWLARQDPVFRIGPP